MMICRKITLALFNKQFMNRINCTLLFCCLLSCGAAIAQSSTPVYNNLYFEHKLSPERNKPGSKARNALIQNEAVETTTSRLTVFEYEHGLVKPASPFDMKYDFGKGIPAPYRVNFSPVKLY
jgi:hypothetical protein